MKPLASILSELRVREGSEQRRDMIQFKCEEGAGLRAKMEGGVGCDHPGSVEAQPEVVAVWVVRRVRFWVDFRSRTRRICWWHECKVGEKEDQGWQPNFLAHVIRRVVSDSMLWQGCNKGRAFAFSFVSRKC